MQVLTVIPQLFYDLISRVVPGVVTMIAVSGALGLKPGEALGLWVEGAPVLGRSPFFLALITLVLSYLIGQVIGPLSDFWQKKVVARLFPAFFHVLQDAVSSSSNGYPKDIKDFLIKELKQSHKSGLTEISSYQYTVTVHAWFEWVRIHNADTGNRLAKIRAEYRMHAGIGVVLVLALVLHPIAVALHWAGVSWIFVILAVVGAGLSHWALTRTHRIFQRSVINNYYVLKTSPWAEKLGKYAPWA